MYIAGTTIRGKRSYTTAYATRDEAAAAFFAMFPRLKHCSTSDAFERDGRWFERHTDIRFHDRPYKQQRDPGFVDLDRAYEDQCAAICGR